MATKKNTKTAKNSKKQREIIEMAASMGITPNKTYQDVTEAFESYVNSKVVTELETAIALNKSPFPARLNLSLRSEVPGIGKTSFATSFCEDRDLKYFFMHAPTISVDRLQQPDVEKDEDGNWVMTQAVLKEITEAEVIIIDEADRAPKSVQNVLMELQNGTIGGKPLRDGFTVIRLDNSKSGNSGVRSQSDLAQATRFRQIDITPKDTPWQYFLAKKYSDVDLLPLFTWFDSQCAANPTLIEKLPPRTLDHVIYMTLNGAPGAWALPVLMKGRDQITDKNGNTITAEVMKKIASLLGCRYRATLNSEELDKFFRKAVNDGENILIIGEPGAGKTEWVKSVLKDMSNDKSLGLTGNPLYLSAPVIDWDRYVIPVPSRNGIDLEVTEELTPDDGELVVVIDEIWRGDKQTQNQLLEFTGSKRVGGRKIPLRSVVAISNPKKSKAGVSMNVGQWDRAMADRFTATVVIESGMIDSPKWLRNEYGTDVEARAIVDSFLEWHAADLGSVDRLYVNYRVLERMIARYLITRDLKGLSYDPPIINGSRVEVDMSKLRRRLKGTTVPSLVKHLKDIEDVLPKLDEKHPETGSCVNLDLQNSVWASIREADQALIEDNWKDCVRLMQMMPRPLIINQAIAAAADSEDKRKMFLDLILGKKNSTSAVKQGADASARFTPEELNLPS